MLGRLVDHAVWCGLCDLSILSGFCLYLHINRNQDSIFKVINACSLWGVSVGNVSVGIYFWQVYIRMEISFHQ